ncbi:MAG TPA: hypothetical protein VMD91_15065 [Candidatus Sulfotelmatobacter sp.]|nr:hypothetical protein [Candidatus Sulfotelmatobacter sp.]
MYLPPLSTPSPTFHDGYESGMPAMSGAPVPFGATAASGPGDGLGSSWSCGNGGANGAGCSTQSGGLLANLSSLLTSLVSALQQLLGSLGASGGGGYGNGNGYGAGNGYGGTGYGNGFGNGGSSYGYAGFGGEPRFAGLSEPFSEVTISSTGDPHLAETGTLVGGQAVNQRYDSMSAQPDLVSSNLAGGYRVSTTVTTPNAHGVTWNQTASVSADHGRDLVTMDDDGSFTVSEEGRALALQRGQTLTLGGGETVTENTDGSLVVNAANGRGGTVATTLQASGGGVNVTTTAHNVQLGGAVVAHGR